MRHWGVECILAVIGTGGPVAVREYFLLRLFNAYNNSINPLEHVYKHPLYREGEHNGRGGGDANRHAAEAVLDGVQHALHRGALLLERARARGEVAAQALPHVAVEEGPQLRARVLMAVIGR
eukprot:6982829-Pyramimonas_sp.AAC.1